MLHGDGSGVLEIVKLNYKNKLNKNKTFHLKYALI